MRKAQLFTVVPQGVICTLCERQCLLHDGERGACGVRVAVQGEIWTEATDRVTRVVPRRVEALGLYHVLPGSRALTVAFETPDDQAAAVDPVARVLHSWNVEELPDLARRAGCTSIAFGYVEPTWYIESLVPALAHARASGLLGLVQTNGALTTAAIDELAPVLDAAHLTIPTLIEGTARREEAVPPHVLRDTLTHLHHRGVWVEVTTVLVPGVNDSERELLEIALSLKAVDGTIPWHVRCIPTDEHTLARWAETVIERALGCGARAGLEYVYASEAPGSDRELTFCHVCRDVVLVERFLGQPRNLMAEGRRCPRCRTQAHGLFHPRPRAAAAMR